jgi:hypothetical protein
MQLARLDEAFPLTCPQCGADMRIIAFIAEAVDGRTILEPIGEPATPPRIASARGPPAWYEDSGEEAIDAFDPLQGDPIAPPGPAYAYDQRVSWSRPAEGPRDSLLSFARNVLRSLPLPAVTTASKTSRQPNLCCIMALRWTDGLNRIVTALPVWGILWCRRLDFLSLGLVGIGVNLRRIPQSGGGGSNPAALPKPRRGCFGGARFGGKMATWRLADAIHPPYKTRGHAKTAVSDPRRPPQL